MTKKKKRINKRNPIRIDLSAVGGQCTKGPQNVRNFWIETDVDGYANSCSSMGPKSPDGGMSITIYQRHNEVLKKALTIQGIASDGSIILSGMDGDGDELFKIGSQR